MGETSQNQAAIEILLTELLRRGSWVRIPADSPFFNHLCDPGTSNESPLEVSDSFCPSFLADLTGPSPLLTPIPFSINCRIRVTLFYVADRQVTQRTLSRGLRVRTDPGVA